MHSSTRTPSQFLGYRPEPNMGDELVGLIVATADLHHAVSMGFEASGYRSRGRFFRVKLRNSSQSYAVMSWAPLRMW